MKKEEIHSVPISKTIYYCDQCKKEIPEYDGLAHIEIHLTTNKHSRPYIYSTQNNEDHHLCYPCADIISDEIIEKLKSIIPFGHEEKGVR